MRASEFLTVKWKNSLVIDIIRKFGQKTTVVFQERTAVCVYDLNNPPEMSA